MGNDSQPVFTLIRHGEVYAPEPLGITDILLAQDRIARIGDLDAGALRALGIECQVIDAAGCVVTPGLIDPHEHLIGAGGEEGFISRMPEILFSQIVSAGITTVVGLVGTDTVTRYLPCLYAKACQLSDEGLTTYLYTGGFEIPPRTLMSSIQDDLVMIDKIIGVGEIAIADPRWVEPELNALAQVVYAAKSGGAMSGKAGVTHFHVGPSDLRLSTLHKLLDEYEIPPEKIYLTHASRTRALLDDAITLAQQGVYVDMDSIEENLAECVRYYLSHGGPRERLTVSSDAHTPGGSPSKHFEQFRAMVREGGFTLEEVLPLLTRNVAEVLKLGSKGRLRERNDADVLILRRETLDIAHLFARGRQMIREGELLVHSKQEEQTQEGKR